jgi:hypothetical protein
MAQDNDLHIDEPVILVRVNRLYEEGMSETALYEITRGVWKVGPRREKAEYALAVYKGEVKAVYSIKSWHRAGWTPYKTRKGLKVEGRWEFVGAVADEKIRNKYIGRSVKHFFTPHSQNPITYVNC